jgi:IS30 family transposase
MSERKQLSERRGVAVFFANPDSPWERGSNENTLGLLRQYLPKGTDLSGFTKDEPNAMAWPMNNRPRKKSSWGSAPVSDLKRNAAAGSNVDAGMSLTVLRLRLETVGVIACRKNCWSLF